MGFIKVEISKTTDADGKIKTAKLRRFESDLGQTSYDINRLLHSLTAPNSAAIIQMWMVLDEGILDRDKLYGREYMILGSGTLDIDYL